MKILIVEDQAILAIAMELYFKKSGFNICGIAQTSIKAINMTKEHNPDIILMDTYLRDDINGIEVACKIKEFSNAKIIFCTGADDETINEIKKIEPAAIIKKPINFDQLIKIIKNILII